LAPPRHTHWLTSPAVSLLAGAAQALSIADPWTGQPHWWLQIASLALLAWQLAKQPVRAELVEAGSQGFDPSTSSGQAKLSPNGYRGAWRGGFWRGWLFGLGWLAGTFWWLFISMHTYGGMAAPLAVAAVLALALALALYYALAAAVFAALAGGPLPERQPALCALGFAALWTLAELLRGTLFTGFPWGAGGYAHVDGPLAFLPRYVGVYGLGFAAAALAALPAVARHIAWRGRRARAACLLILLTGAGLWGWRWHELEQRPPGQPPLVTEVTLLQGNIPQDEKFIPGTGVADSLRWYGEQLRAASAPLVVAPETALPVLPRQLPDGYLAALAERFSRPGQAALLGIPLGDADSGYTNSVIGLAPGPAPHGDAPSPGAARHPLPQAGEGKERPAPLEGMELPLPLAGEGRGEGAPYRYDKRHLVPFGEFIPPLFQWFVRLMNMPLGDFNRGGANQPSFAWQGQRLAPNICYEDLFGEELAARFADPARAPTAFVNVSNIAWFGDSVAIDQHLQISRMRALEFERPMLRATNTGATAIIDDRGEVTHLLPRLTRAALTGRFEGRTQITPYARWVSLFGLWPLVAVCVLLVGASCSLARLRSSAVML